MQRSDVSEQLARVLSFPFQLRFLFASRPLITGQVLGIVYRAISIHLVKEAGYSKKTARTGAVTLIQRFGSALNLNIHFVSDEFNHAELYRAIAEYSMSAVRRTICMPQTPSTH